MNNRSIVRIQALVNGLIGVLIVECAIAAPLGSEGLLGTSHLRKTPSGNDSVQLSSGEAIPAAVSADLADLDRKFDELALPLNGKNGALVCSWDGRGLLHQVPRDTSEIRIEPDGATPTGVTIWPDWRNCDETLKYPEASRGWWLSRHHVRLAHVSPNGDVLHVIVDVRAPKRAFDVPRKIAGCAWRNTNVGVTDAGIIAGATVDCGLWIGKLNEGGGDLAGTLFPLAAPICNVLVLNDRWIIAQTAESPLSRLFVVDATTGVVTAEFAGRLTGLCGQISTAGCRLGERAFSFLRTSGSGICTVSPSGDLSVQSCSSDLAPIFPSPSGAEMYGLTPGWPSARYSVERTPLAIAGTTTTPVPTGAGSGGAHEHIQVAGWLTWQMPRR